VDGTAEEHLRIGALEDAGDAGAPLELLPDDRPDRLMSSLGILDLLLPELGEPLPDARAPGTIFGLHLRLCARLCEFCGCEGSIQATEAAVATNSSPSLSSVEHTTALVAKHLFL